MRALSAAAESALLRLRKQNGQRRQGEQHGQSGLHQLPAPVKARGKPGAAQHAERLAVDACAAPAEQRRAGEKARARIGQREDAACQLQSTQQKRARQRLRRCRRKKMQQQARKHRKEHQKSAHAEDAAQRALHSRRKGGGEVRPCGCTGADGDAAERRQPAADQHTGEKRGGSVDEIERRACARRMEDGAAADAKQEAGTGIVAEGEQAVALGAVERAGSCQLRAHPRADRVAAAEAHRQCGRACAGQAEQRAHQRGEQRRKQCARAAGDQQR